MNAHQRRKLRRTHKALEHLKRIYAERKQEPPIGTIVRKLAKRGH